MREEGADRNAGRNLESETDVQLCQDTFREILRACESNVGEMGVQQEEVQGGSVRSRAISRRRLCPHHSTEEEEGEGGHVHSMVGRELLTWHQ